MKKCMKKWVSLCLVGIMIAGLSAGCSKSSEPNSDKGNTVTSSDAQGGSATSSVPEEKPTITVSIYDRGTVPASEGTVTDNRWTKWINENAPVNVEFVSVPRNTSGEALSAMFAAGNAPDLIQEWSVSNLNTFYTQGVLMPLNDLIENSSVEYKALLEKYPSLKDLLTKEDGQMYTLGDANYAASNHYMMIRQDWLDNLGLSVPKTDEELLEVCKAFTNNDPDQNGKNDTLGMSLAATNMGIITAMYGGMGNWLYNWYKEDPQSNDNTIVYHWDHAQAYVGFEKSLYDAGTVPPDYATDTTGEQAMQDFYNGKTGIVGLNAGRPNMLNFLTNFKANNPNGKVEPIALPSTQFGNFAPAGGTFMASFGAINADCKNPEAVMAYVDWLNHPEVLKMLRYGGDEYSQVDPNTGAYVPKDADKFKTEVSYNMDYYMPSSKVIDPYDTVLPFDTSDPIQAEAKDLIIKADKMYLDPSLTFYQLMIRPSMPDDLNIIQTNIGTQIDDIFTKCILSGNDYTVDQAMADAKKIFDNAGGDQITAYYNDWYSKNNGFITTDAMAEMLPDYVKQ